MRNFLTICLMITCISLTAQEERTPFSIFAAHTEMGGDLSHWSQAVTIGGQYRLVFSPKFNLNFELEGRFGSEIDTYFGNADLDQYALNCIPEFRLNDRFSIMLGGGFGYIGVEDDSATVLNGLAGVTFAINSRFKLFIRQDYFVELTSSDGRAGFTNESLTAGLTKAGLYFNF